MKLNYFQIVIFLILFSSPLYAESNITDFDENWAVNGIVNYNMGIFGGTNSSEYRTDKPFDLGIGIRYKTMSAQAVVSLSIFESFDIWAFDFGLNYYLDNIYFDAYFKNYTNLYDFNKEKDTGLDIHTSGITAAFVHNNKNHSLGSVIKLDKKQNISSGSFLYGFGVFHTSLHSTNEAINKYKERQHLLYFGPSIGYSYTFVFSNDIFLNLSLSLFANPAVILNTNNWLFIPKFKPDITIGHHNKSWSLNLRMMNFSDVIVWNIDDIETITVVSISFLFTKRF